MSIYAALCTALRDEGRAVVATIVRASGSTPAPADSTMMVRTQPPYRSSGTIGGGCLDENVFWCVKEDPARTRSRFFTFNLNDDIGDTGLTCGGTIDVLLEPVDASALPVYDELVRAEEAGEPRVLASVIMPEGPSRISVFTRDGVLVAGDAGSLQQHIAQLSSEDREGTVRMKVGEIEIVLRYVIPAPRLVVFGGGHVGAALVKCAALAGFRVTLVDDRPRYALRERTPEAHGIICAPFDEAVEQCAVGPATYVVIVTRGHKHDERILERVLACGPRYTGMIGSVRKVAVTFGNLRERGIDAATLARVHAPVGLDIGSVTPGEIAVSIVAELIAIRRASPVVAPKHQSVSRVNR